MGKPINPAGHGNARVGRCQNYYWEISDAHGNIIANNFISTVLQFTIYVPPTAAEFIAEGCGFRWISG